MAIVVILGVVLPWYSDMVSLQYEINQMHQFSLIGMHWSFHFPRKETQKNIH